MTAIKGEHSAFAPELWRLENGGWSHVHADGDRCAHLDGTECNLHRSAQTDPIDHPAHYLAHPSGVECITITEHMGFNLGNVVKYVWRADLKGDAIEDLKKARWYLTREIERLGAKP